MALYKREERANFSCMNVVSCELTYEKYFSTYLGCFSRNTYLPSFNFLNGNGAFDDWWVRKFGICISWKHLVSRSLSARCTANLSYDMQKAWVILPRLRDFIHYFPAETPFLESVFISRWLAHCTVQFDAVTPHQTAMPNFLQKFYSKNSTKS